MEQTTIDPTIVKAVAAIVVIFLFVMIGSVIKNRDNNEGIF